MIAQNLKKSILQEAISGRLVPQIESEGTAEDILREISKQQKKKITFSEIPEEEQPFPIPSSWKWVRLGELCDVVRGGSPRPAGSPIYYDGNIPFLKVADLTKDENVYVDFAVNSIKEAGLTKTRMVKAGTLLLTNSGATLGVPKITTFDTTFNDGIAAFLNLNDDIKLYCYWFFRSHTEKYRSINQGTGQPNLNTDIIARTLLPLPPLSEQRRIVTKLETLLPKIDSLEKTETRLSLLESTLGERLWKSVLQEAISGRLTTQQPSDGTADDLLEQIKAAHREAFATTQKKYKPLTFSPIPDSEIPFEIPENWRWVRLGEINSIYTGNSISESEKAGKYTNVAGIQYIGTKDVGFDHIIEYDNGVAIPKQFVDKFKIAPAKTVLLCIEGGSAGRKIAMTDRDVCFGNKLCCFAPFVDLSQYVYYFLQSPSFFEVFNVEKNGIIGGVSVNTIKSLPIPLPPLSEQLRIVSKLEKLRSALDKRG